MNLTPFLDKHQLPDEYVDTVKQCFMPVIDEIVAHAHHKGAPIILGVNGSQGSGKSTFADLFCYIAENLHYVSVVSLSIDDFYYTYAQRESLANTIHPLLLTRGVPGTHDVDLSKQTILNLKNYTSPVSIPRFDKACDDRKPEDEWDIISATPDIILLEGWCVGSAAQDDSELLAPVNELEENEDRDLVWRRYVNRCLTDDYQDLFSLIDVWVMLKAPSFDSVMDWRTEQEQKLADAVKSKKTSATSIMDRAVIERFIQHYQRITEHTIKTLPDKMNYVFELDNLRSIETISRPIPLRRLS